MSNSATPASLVQSRSTNAASGSSAGAGGAESIQYSSPTSDWTGLVVLNKGGSGTATVYRDQSAPTGASVEINGGAASTNNRDVNLALAASDAQTGLMDMRISVDGVFDTETWVPYSTSGAATVPDGRRHEDCHRPVPQQRRGDQHRQRHDRPGAHEAGLRRR